MEKLKSDLVKSKEEILACMADKVDGQNSSTSLMGLMSLQMKLSIKGRTLFKLRGRPEVYFISTKVKKYK